MSALSFQKIGLKRRPLTPIRRQRDELNHATRHLSPFPGALS